MQVSGEVSNFMDASTQGWGAHMGDSQILSIWTRSECRLHPHQYFGSQGGNAGPPSLGLNITDNTTFVAYINKQGHEGGNHSHTLLPLVVDLFLWLRLEI